MTATSVTPAELRGSLQLLVDAKESEAGQRTAIARALAALGHVHTPHVVAGRMDGATLRVYTWDFAGGILLATGPSFKGKVFAPGDIRESQPGLYILAGVDTTKAAVKAGVTAARWRPAKQAKEPRATLKRMTKYDRKSAAHHASKLRERSRDHVAQIPSARMLGKAERQELIQSLQALLGDDG